MPGRLQIFTAWPRKAIGSENYTLQTVKDSLFADVIITATKKVKFSPVSVRLPVKMIIQKLLSKSE